MNKTIVNIDNINKSIQYSMDVDNIRNLQFDVIDSKKNTIGLINICEQLSGYNIDIQALGGKVKTHHRENIDITLERAIEYLSTSNFINTSLKTYHTPLCHIHEYQKDAYIEFCTRFSVDKDYNDMFIWIYIDIEHLEHILKQFENKLIYYTYE